MHKLLLLFSLTCSCYAFSGGAEMLLEIGYHSNGKTQKAFVSVAYTNNDLSIYLDDSKLFRKYLEDITGPENEVTAFGQIIDQEEISKMVSFPMHAYEPIANSQKTIRLDDLKRLKLIKIWTRSSYGIQVLSTLSKDDRYWLVEKPTLVKKGFQDVGCRIEFYDHGSNGDNHPLYTELLSAYPNDGSSLTQKQLENITPIIAALKEKKIVVVELCGC